MSDTNQAAAEAVTVYLWPEQQIILEELKLRLRRQGVKVTKSQLVRVAIHLLSERKLPAVIERLND